MHTPQVNVTVPTPNVNFEAGSFAPSFNLEVPDDLHPTQLPQQQPQQSSDVDWNYIENVDVSFNDWIGKRPEMVDEMVSSFRRVIEGKESWQNLPARGLLLYGPPGTGKSKLAQAIAGALNVPFIGIGADQLSQKYIGEGAKTVRRIFAQARALDKYVILFIDEIDAAARKRGTENTHAEDERTLDALLQVITEPQNEKILIIGATNNKNTIDSAAKRSGRLTSVEINAPDKKGIEDIFEYYLGKVGTRTSFDWKQSLATMKGFTGADIESLIKWATAYTRNHSGSIITQDSFNKALGIVKQAKRDTEYTFECIKPEDITYEEIVEANLPKLTADLINYFINLDKYKNAKIQIPRGMLLYGTPGTGKSTLAKHIAKKSGLDLISINGSDLCEKYREGAKCVTALFEQARSLEKPVIIAIDEIDSAGKKKSDGATQEDQIVLNALARELENPKNSSVFVIGTTNYKDSIEPALIRPGRIDFIIPMKLPNPQMRVRLLVAQLQRLFGSTVNLKNAMGHIDQQLDEKSLMAAVLKVANIALTPAKITNLFGDKKIFDPRDVFFINQLINYGMVLGLKCDDILELTDKMEYFSPSDIKSLAETASLLAKLRDINAKPNKKDFDDAIDLQKVKVEGKLDKTENFFKKFALNFIPGAQTFKEARYGKYADLASELCP
jgi:ATP-dependent 26S proteasome regulatory subunit